MVSDEKSDLERFVDDYLQNKEQGVREVVRTEVDDEDHVHIILKEVYEEKPKKDEKFIPEYFSQLKQRIVEVPEEIYKATGIKIFGTRIKSILFTTDVALIRNSNAQAVFAVYPFTPQVNIMQSILNVASVPVFLGVGGGTTTGARSVNLSFQAEQLGAYGVVVNGPIKVEVVAEIDKIVDVPVIATITNLNDKYLEKLQAGADMLNISGGANTVDMVRQIRSEVGDQVPIIATGGPSGETIAQTIEAGANAITYTPPTSGDIFAEVMEKYRHISD